MLRRILGGLTGLLLLGSGLALAATNYTQGFDVAPLTPQPARPGLDWDIAVHSDSLEYGSIAGSVMDASHGADCGAPPATHAVGTHEDQVFFCKNHVMTAIAALGNYGVIYLTPPQLLDWSAGEAVLRWDMSTLRTSARDWIDVWVSPYADHLQMPLEDQLPDLQGPPRNALQLRMDNTLNGSMFRVRTVRDYVLADLPGNSYRAYDTVLSPDAARRDTFELRVTRTHLKAWMPAYNLVWFDGAIPDLGWDQGVVQFGHHSYNPLKDCGGVVTAGCAPNTWHWDNVSLAPAVPFTIIPVTPRGRTYHTGGGAITFASPAPAGSMLQFGSWGTNQQVSWTNGATWVNVPLAPQHRADISHASNYAVPVPEGATGGLIRASGTAFGPQWHVQDLSVWSPQGGPPAPRTATPTPAPRTPTAAPPTVTVTAPPSSTPGPTSTPQPTATLLPTVLPTPEGTDAPTITPTSPPRCGRWDVINGGAVFTPYADSQCMQ